MNAFSKTLKALILKEVRNILNEHGDEPHKIVSYYEVWTPEDVEHGETFDKGDNDEETLELDEWDREEGLTMVDKAVSYLKDNYIDSPSSSHFHPGVWYTAHASDPHSGDTKNVSFHLKGFSKTEEAEVFDELGRPTN